MSDNGLVAVSVCNSYHPEEVRESLEQCFKLMEFRLPQGARVLVKPNAVTKNTPDQATGTHYAILDALCGLLTEAECSISIGDSSSYYHPGYTRRSFDTLKFTEVAKKHGAQMIFFEERPFLTLKRSDLENDSTRRLPLYVCDTSEFDLVINVPKLKVHRITRVSAAVKNLFGLVPGGVKQLYHEELKYTPDYLVRFASLINDVYLQVKPGLNILDGIVGLERDGPASNGDPRRTRFMMAARDAMALDIALCGVIGEQPCAVTTIRDVLGRGLISLDSVRLVGKVPKVEFVLLQEPPRPGRFRRRLTDYIFKNMMVKPVVDATKCDGCGVCAERCQAGAIMMQPAVTVDATKCIYCYACPSFCANHAIELQGSTFYTVLQKIRTITGM